MYDLSLWDLLLEHTVKELKFFKFQLFSVNQNLDLQCRSWSKILLAHGLGTQVEITIYQEFYDWNLEI